MGLRILYVTEDFSQKNTGITAVIRQLTGWLVEHSDWVGVYSTGKPDKQPPQGVQLFYDDDFKFPHSWRLPKGLAKRLGALIKENEIQIVHLHGLWRAAPWVAQRVANQLKVPTILTVHGQLEPWAWSGQGWLKALKKRLYWSAVAKPVFQNISMLHAITPLESKSYRTFLPDKRIEEIPNAVDLEQLDIIQKNMQAITPEQVILFLGRIHPIKGVDILLHAFAEARLGDDWRLVIAGPEEVPEYANRLRELIVELGIESKTEFIGAIYGQKKITWLKRAWVLVVPSLSEVIGMVNLEASACQTPTITTYPTGLMDWSDGGGLLIEPEKMALQQALREVASWSMDHRLERGAQSRELIIKKYSLDVVGERWLRFYSSLISSE